VRHLCRLCAVAAPAPVASTTGLLLCAALGCIVPAYAFGLYSNAFKKELNFSQSDVDLVSSSGNLGGYSAVLGGLLLDRFGPLVAGLAGSVLMLCGYLLQWAGINKWIGHTPVGMSLCA
jgi:hypothetical protein